MHKFPYLILGIFLFAFDQISKWFVTEVMIKVVVEKPMPSTLGFFEWLTSAPPRLPPVSIEMLPFFNIVMVWNQGVSFGMFSNGSPWGPWFLSSLSVLISIGFLIWLGRSSSRLQSIALVMVIAGALGNVLDRLRFGAVIDFIDVHAMGTHWPAFNIADSCICIGVFLLIVQSFFFESGEKSAK
ncbi:MAG: signal peptidase II [Rhodospirillales bacterium]|nr:signal peptidase II [Rhodospirillales bacterium]